MSSADRRRLDFVLHGATPLGLRCDPRLPPDAGWSASPPGGHTGRHRPHSGGAAQTPPLSGAPPRRTQSLPRPRERGGWPLERGLSRAPPPPRLRALPPHPCRRPSGCGFGVPPEVVGSPQRGSATRPRLHTPRRRVGLSPTTGRPPPVSGLASGRG